MSGIPNTDQNQGSFWTEGGNRTYTGTVLGNFWNEVSGTTAQNEFSAAEAEKARAFSSVEAQKNRDWETMMSNTAYQRAVADMKAAGLNPAAIGGNAASTPSGGVPGTAAATSAAAGGSGGLLGMVAGIAKVALGKALMAKFLNTAQRAADNHELVGQKVKTLAAQEAQALSAEQKHLAGAAASYDSRRYGTDDVKAAVEFLRHFYGKDK